MENELSPPVGRHAGGPRFQWRVLVVVTGLFVSGVIVTQITPSDVRKLGPTAESVYDLFKAPVTEPLGLRSQRLVADVKALGGHAGVVERSPALFGYFGRKELFSIYVGGRQRGGNSNFGDQDLAWLVKNHADRVWGIYLSHSYVTDAGLSVLPALTNIRHLSMEFSASTVVSHGSTSELPRITDAGLEHVGKLQWLQSLHLRGLPITDAGLENLADLTDLRVLYLERSQIRGPGLARLSSLHHLVSLNLSRSALTDEGLSYLVGSPIYHLTLDGVSLSGAGLKALIALASLRRLEIRGCGVADEAVDGLKKAMPNLEIVR